jgi:hypothetical protein
MPAKFMPASGPPCLKVQCPIVLWRRSDPGDSNQSSLCLHRFESGPNNRETRSDCNPDFGCDIDGRIGEICFTPKNGRAQDVPPCPIGRSSPTTI